MFALDCFEVEGVPTEEVASSEVDRARLLFDEQVYKELNVSSITI